MSSVLFEAPLPSKPGDKLIWQNAFGCSLAYQLAKAQDQVDAPFLMITPDTQRALRLERELKQFCDKSLIHVFPDWETLPYDSFSPHQDIVSDRLSTLATLPRLTKGIVIVPITTLMQRLPPSSFVQTHSFVLKVGDTLDITKTSERLTDNCYRRVSEVQEHGEFAHRGSILDIYPMGSTHPIRIDLFDDEVETLRWFDASTQLSIEQVNSIELLPGREFPFTEEAIKGFRSRWRETFSGNPKLCPIYQDISNRLMPSGVEYYLPLFYEQMSTFVDYLPESTVCVFMGTIYGHAQSHWQSIETRYDQYGHDIQRPILEPAQLYQPVEQLFASLKPLAQIQVYENQQTDKAFDFSIHNLGDISFDHKAENPLARLKQFMAANDVHVLVCAETMGRAQSLSETFEKHGMSLTQVESPNRFFENPVSLGLTVAPLDEGFYSPAAKVAIIAESQFYGTQVMQRRRRRKSQIVDPDLEIRHIAQLQVGDPIVHLDFGVGRYCGMVTMDTAGYEAEFLQIEYSGADKLYVPVNALHLISKYQGMDPEKAPINTLGTKSWDKAKKKALEKASDVAAELLNIYAQREAKQGHSFDAPDDHYDAFSEQFPFEETADQLRAIEEVLTDMSSKRPMDRVVCGDVGFGKTEVAMRAAFLAVHNQKQVAILVPTTLLAQQHYETFCDRFAGWPIQIAQLSRFKTKQEQDSTLKALEEGRVDIVIGTHKLVQPDVKFKNLGLVIIDEEHRFGVKQKEKLKSMRAEVDILTLTATPIPRTLNMAFSKLRDLSIIATPPQKRLSIKTFVREKQNALIKEAVLRELMRGGQVYFLHNSVDTINKTAADLAELIPEARIGVAHGQLRERELEGVMADFYHQRFNVLVCTTIIETGIDIPSANTIIMDRADKLGLAQLHQLRGRVGRSHHQAYAYCLTPPRKSMKSDAIKRLEALESLEDLGSGFTLASHDLEIRGAGELLGEDQSGNVQTIGFTLYMDILKKSVKALQRGDDPLTDVPMESGPMVDLQIPALIPETYVRDVTARLILYKRISHADKHEELKELQVELIDRFGLLPDAVKHLFRVSEIKLLAQPMGVHKIKANASHGQLEFASKPNINPNKVIELIRSKPTQYQLKGTEVLTFKADMPKPEDRFKTVQQLLTTIH